MNEILSHVSDRDWKKHISGQAVKPLVDGLLNAVSVAKQSKGNGPTARYKAGTKLMNNTKKPLVELKKLTGKSDLQYQMVADKVGLEILQCGIDYYNNTKTYDAPKNAMVLMAYALLIVVGQMARGRCEENVNIVQKAVDNMLPEIVREEAETIEQELQKFYKLPELICHAVTMLNNVKPHLQSIKVKLGAADSSYLKLSTRVVKDAMYNVVQEVNSAQNEVNSNPMKVKQTIQNAWNVTLIMDGFDKEDTFRVKYNENRAALMDICRQCGISPASVEESNVLGELNESLDQVFGSQKTFLKNGSHSPKGAKTYKYSTHHRNRTSFWDEIPAGCFWYIVLCVIGAIFGLVELISSLR